MRNAAWLDRSLTICFWLTSLGCLPQQELAAYSAGAEATSAPAMEPATVSGESPQGVLPDPDGLAEAAGSSSEPSNTPANTDGPAQPEQLAPEAAAPAASPMGTQTAAVPEDPATAQPAPDLAAPPAMADAAPAATEPPAGTEPQPATEPVPLAAPASGQFRFVRLVADSDFNGGPLSAAAELEVFGADGQALDRSGWVATADSAEPTFFGGAPAALAIDGQPASIWHTAWFQLAAPPPHPHFLQLDMGQPRSVTGFRYVARQDASVGRIADYRFFVSVDGVEWGEPILAGRLQDSAQAQDVRLPPP